MRGLIEGLNLLEFRVSISKPGNNCAYKDVSRVRLPNNGAGKDVN